MKDPVFFKQRFAEATRKTQTIEANFIQEKNLSVLSEKITTKGRFLFKKEKKLRWEYTEPFHYLIVLNNGTMLIQDEEEKNKIDIRNNKMLAEINSIIIGCVQGNLFNDEKKFLSSFFENSGSFLVKLKPIASNLKEYFSEIRILFDKNDLSVTQFEMVEPSGDYTRIDFSGEKINTSIPDEKFLVP
ncbi:MAG: outer membrane lipoprotein carrier protein LolA [Bacteroidales bacterium]|jgi:outer membrane lipoprotein-sorting protein